jgi:hypothetical protein
MKEMMQAVISKTTDYKIGDFVKIKIPKEDRHKSDRSHLPCKILGIVGNKYKLGCQFGVLEIAYSGRILERLMANVSELREIPRKKISIREAARLQVESLVEVEENFETTCNCPKTPCDTMRCPCKKAKRNCNTACHPDKECLNLG